MEDVTQTASIPTKIDDFGSGVKGVDANKTKEEGEGLAEEENMGEISSELQPLMQRLEAKVESGSEPGQLLGWIVVKVDGEHTRISYWLFEDESYKFVKECRVLMGAQAKLRLLQAIGSCTTLRRISVYHLTGNELEALLTPLPSNPVLEDIFIDSAGSSAVEFDYEESDSEDSSAAEPESAADGSVERICEILGRILQTSRTLKVLRLYLWGVTAAGVCHLASGVRGNTDSPLGKFSMGKWEESGVASLVAEIVLSALRLEELQVYGGVIKEDGIDALANALANSTSLKRLWLDGVVRGAAALLHKALIGDGSNKSIATLRMTGGMEGIGDFLSRLLSANQSLKELVCVYRKESRPSPSQWPSVAQSLSSSSLELFRIEVPWYYVLLDPSDKLLSALDLKNSCVGLYLKVEQSATRIYPWYSPSEWKDEEAKMLLLDMNKKTPIIELHLFHLDSCYSSIIWNFLADALNSEDIHFSSLYLQMGPWARGIEEKGVEEKDVDRFFQALRGSYTVRLVTLDGGKGEYWPGGWTKLIDCLRSNISITHLRLIDCDDLDGDVFEQFMGVLQVNLTLKKIRLNGTSWETDGKKALIEEALRRNAVQDSYFSTFRRYGLQFQPATNG